MLWTLGMIVGWLVGAVLLAATLFAIAGHFGFHNEEHDEID